MCRTHLAQWFNRNAYINLLVLVPARGVLSRVCIFIIEELHKMVESACQESAHQWAQPIDPMIRWKIGRGDTGPEGASRVDGRARVIHPRDVDDK